MNHKPAYALAAVFILACASLQCSAQALLTDVRGDSLKVEPIKIEMGYIYCTLSGNAKEQRFPANQIRTFIPHFYDKLDPGIRKNQSQRHQEETDLLISMNDDSLKIRMKKIEFDQILFDSSAQSANTYYPVNRIKKYLPDYFANETSETLTNHNEVETEEPRDSIYKPMRATYDPSVFRISAQLGWGYVLGRSEPDISPQDKQHLDGLRNGFLIGAGVDLFLNRWFGFGIQYSLFNASHETLDYSLFSIDGNLVDVGILADEIRTHSATVRIHGRIFAMGNRLAFLPYVGANKIWFRDIQSFNNLSYKLTSETYGAVGGLAVDFKLNEALGVGIDFGVLLAAIVDYKIVTPNNVIVSGSYQDSGNNISRSNLSIGLRWMW